eukprot:Skav216502  [mRNA]  locus=scaffold1123:599491:600899:- [translate_table: standard]
MNVLEDSWAKPWNAEKRRPSKSANLEVTLTLHRLFSKSEPTLQSTGADGTKQHIQLLPSSYVAEVTSNAMVWTQKYLLGILPYWWPELEEASSCATLIGTAEYVGYQAWILGTPLFYNRRAAWLKNLWSSGKPPAIQAWFH